MRMKFGLGDDVNICVLKLVRETCRPQILLDQTALQKIILGFTFSLVDAGASASEMTSFRQNRRMKWGKVVSKVRQGE